MLRYKSNIVFIIKLLNVLFILTSFILVNNNAFSETELVKDNISLSIKDRLINLKAKNASLKEILRAFEKETDIAVVFLEDAGAEKVSMDIKSFDADDIIGFLKTISLQRFAIVYGRKNIVETIYVLPIGFEKSTLTNRNENKNIWFSEDNNTEATHVMEATRVAFGFIKRQSDTGSRICGEWDNKFITFSKSVTFYGKNEDINGYEFPVFADGYPAGYIYVYSQNIKKSPIPFFSTIGKAPSDLLHDQLEALAGKAIDKSKIVFFRFGLAKIIALLEKEMKSNLYKLDLPLTEDGRHFILGHRDAVGITSKEFRQLVDQKFQSSGGKLSVDFQKIEAREKERKFYYNNSEGRQKGLQFGVKKRDEKK